MELPGHIVEFMLKHFGDADSHGEIAIDFDSAEAIHTTLEGTRKHSFPQQKNKIMDPTFNFAKRIIANYWRFIFFPLP
jgi:hypothetical protein